MKADTGETPRRIGVFGGTFDPIHNVHLAVARAALAQMRLDRVVFVVSARPPHKRGGPVASPEHRYAMVEAALAGEPRLVASRTELDRQGTSYTVDTLAAFEEEHPGAALFLILGLDSLVDLPGWRDPEGILARARLVVIPRPGAWDIPPEVRGHYDTLDFDQSALSSTEIRERAAAGLPLDGLVPPGAIAIIAERGIYRE